MNPHYNPYPPQQPQPDPSKYPTLPPIQNPHASYPPQNNHFPVHNGYIPPAPYGHIQAGQPQEIDHEKLANENKLKELDSSLENCGTGCYKMWLLLNIFWSFISLLRALPAFTGGDYHDVIFTWFIFYLFTFAKSTVGMVAVYQKSLGKASFISWLVVISALFSLRVWGATYQYLKSMPSSARNYTEGASLAMVNVGLGVIFAVYAIVDIAGAVRIRRILMEREVVKARLLDATEGLNKI